jgi:hypothetical protein
LALKNRPETLHFPAAQVDAVTHTKPKRGTMSDLHGSNRGSMAKCPR